MLAMRVFVRVVEAGTFTNAANSLRMPKPTVTKLVQGLESHLRIKLLNRTTRRVTVTPDGSAYYERVVRLLGDLEDIESSVTHAKERPRGRLRIDAGAAMSYYLILPALPEFLAKYPEIDVECGVSDRPADLIGDNVDCVIRGGPLLEPSLVARHIGDMRWMTCATPAISRNMAEAHAPHAIWNPATCSRAIFSRAAAACARWSSSATASASRSRRALVSPSTTAARISRPCAPALGLGQLLSFMVSASNATQELVPVLKDWQPEPMPVHVLYPGESPPVDQGARVRRLGRGAVFAKPVHALVSIRARENPHRSSSLALATAFAAQAAPPRLEKHGSTQQLIVDGKPFLILGGELGNSSARARSTCARTGRASRR